MPKIIFRYSWVYDEIWKNSIKNALWNKPHPSATKTQKFIQEAEKLWHKDERKVLKEMGNVTKLKWKNDITCYVVGNCVPFSEPLTLPVIEKYPDYFIDVLVHELLHQLLFVQNQHETKSAWDFIFRKYRKEMLNTKIHIPVHAIHNHIYLKFFNENRMKRDIKLVHNFPDYRRSWQIVQKEGYQNIIEEFVKRIK